MNDDSLNSVMTMRPGGDDSLGRIDQYEILHELGGGGFGTVYLAKDTVSGVEVAVKGLPPFVKNNREEMENIRANFALVSRLHHPNIAAALVLHPAKSVNYVSDDVKQNLRVLPGDTLMVMEYAPGVTLSQWRRQFPECKVPMDKALEIVRQIAPALDYAHERKIIHRDIKPANVMVETTADGMLTARVLDFGLAAEIRSSMGRVSQEIHDTSGTRPYMAPEQWSGASQNAGTDQYALAVLFYELVVGKVPFASVFDTGDPVIMLTVVTTRPPDLPADLPKTVRLALGKALAKNPEDRFSSCAEFAFALEGKVKVSRRGAATRRNGGGAGKVLGILAMLVALGGGVWFYLQHQEQQREQARIVAKQKADAERRVKEDAVRLAQEEAERNAAAERRAEEERLAKENADCKVKAESDAAIKAEVDRKAEEARESLEAEKRRKAKELAEAKAAAEARRAAEAEAARKEEAERRAADEKRKADERVAAEKKESRRRQLYSDLAAVETTLENFGQFEYKDAILSKLNSLTASYKAARTAFGSDDFESAFAMIQELKKPCDELKQLVPTIKSYYLRKAAAERAKSEAVAVEAPLYAKKPYDEANEAYEKAVGLADADDYSKALALMEPLDEMFKAAKETAVTNPESMYQKGLAAQKARDNAKAFEMFSKAADRNHPSALINLGLIHMKGMGVAKNESEAFGCFRKAAYLNHARAQYLLGGCYAKAIGTKYDKEQSRLWMIMAKVNGDRTAADFLSKAGWPVSADEEAAVREILETGSSDKSISASLRQIAVECQRSKKVQ